MCTPGVSLLTKELVESYIDGGLGVSFKGLGRRWNTEEDVKDVVEKIVGCENLKYLELEGNTLGVDAAKAIGKALESKPELEAALWKDLFTGRLKNEIPEAMRFLFAGVDLAGARLQYLDLSDNAIGPLGMTGLAPFFKSRSSFSLKVLICNNNGLGPQGAEEFSKALINCKELSLESGGEAFALKTFVCGRNRMQNKGAIAISKFIKECTTLEEIMMPENSVYWQGQVALAEAFSANPKLRVLNLNDNTITGKGIRKLADTFQKLVHLEELNLGDCLLRSNGALLIVNIIKDQPNLKKLVLDGNEISKPTGLEIAQILRKNKSLRHFSISANPVGMAGAEEIQGLLREFETVEVEDIEDSEYEDGNAEINEEGSDGESDDEQNNPGGQDYEEEGDDDENEVNYEDYEDEGEDAVTRAMNFLEVATIENYHAIPGGLPEYVYDLEYLGIPPHEICIQGAIALVENYGQGSSMIPAECETIFCKLMNDAVQFADNETVDFAEALITHLGINRAQSEDCEYYRDEVCNPILECLAIWLINVAKEEESEVKQQTLDYLKQSFQNVRDSLVVDKSKLNTLIDYVQWRRNENLRKS